LPDDIRCSKNKPEYFGKIGGWRGLSRAGSFFIANVLRTDGIEGQS
jgi:hypothetical protein